MSVAEQVPASYAPVAPPVRTLRLRLLGCFELTADDVPWDLPPAEARLVAFLALQARPLSRSQVAGTLWGDRTEERAAACLRSAIWRANAGPAPLIRASRTRLALHALAVDAHEAARAARTQLDGGDPVPPSVLSGELLPGWYDDWLVTERERLRQLFLEAMEQMAESFLAQRQWHRAIEAASQVVTSEPLRESAHRILIEAHLAAGNRGAALGQYEACRIALDRELGLSPGPAVTAAVAGARHGSGVTADR